MTSFVTYNNGAVTYKKEILRFFLCVCWSSFVQFHIVSSQFKVKICIQTVSIFDSSVSQNQIASC